MDSAMEILNDMMLEENYALNKRDSNASVSKKLGLTKKKLKKEIDAQVIEDKRNNKSIDSSAVQFLTNFIESMRYDPNDNWGSNFVDAKSSKVIFYGKKKDAIVNGKKKVVNNFKSEKLEVVLTSNNYIVTTYTLKDESRKEKSKPDKVVKEYYKVEGVIQEHSELLEEQMKISKKLPKNREMDIEREERDDMRNKAIVDEKVLMFVADKLFAKKWETRTINKTNNTISYYGKKKRDLGRDTLAVSVTTKNTIITRLTKSTGNDVTRTYHEISGVLEEQNSSDRLFDEIL